MTLLASAEPSISPYQMPWGSTQPILVLSKGRLHPSIATVLSISWSAETAGWVPLFPPPPPLILVSLPP